MSEEHGLLRIGDPAPDFSAVTTQHTEFNFSVWQEQDWVVLFSHPADFTPVCTTELIGFAHQHDLFRQRNVKLLGLSVDSIHAHLAWVRNIQEKMNVSIPFPMIADADMKIAKLYGMIHPNTSSTATVRAVFIIDPKRIVRALVYYPLNAGRNVDEILRLVIALQTTQRFACATPANWQEGDKVVVPAPKTLNDVEQAMAQPDYDFQDFYLALKDISHPPKSNISASAEADISQVSEEEPPPPPETPTGKPSEGNGASATESTPPA